jgi:hypothetical protein
MATLVPLGLWAALPQLAEYALARWVNGELKAQVEVGRVDVDLAAGEVVFHEAVLRAESTRERLAAASRIALKLDWGVLFGGSIGLERLSLDAPEVLLAYGTDGGLNWASVARPSGPEPGDPFAIAVASFHLASGAVQLVDEAETGFPSLRLAVGEISLDGFTLTRTELGAPLVWALQDIRASDWGLDVQRAGAPPLHCELRGSAGPIAPGGEVPFEFEVRIEEGEEVAIEGRLLPSPFDVSAQLRWQRLPTRGMLHLLSLNDVQVEAGASSGEVEARFSLADGPERGLTARGRVTHLDLSLLIEQETETRLRVERAEAELVALRVPASVDPAAAPEPVRVHWSRVELFAPVITTRLEEPDAGRERSLGDRQDEGARDLELWIDSLIVHDGRIEWRDPVLGPDYERMLGPMELSASAFRWPPVSFQAGRLSVANLGAEPARIEGGWAPGHADLNLRATRIDLTRWQEEVAYYTDYRMSRGRLTLEGPISLRGDRIEAPIDAVASRLQATNPTGSFQATFGISLADAIPLLSDTAGNIHIRLPVRGNLSQGIALDLEAVIQGALREGTMNALQNTAATPIDLTGAALRRIGELVFLGVGEAAFGPGSDELAPSAGTVLRSAAALVHKKRGGRLELLPDVVTDDLRALRIDAGAEGLAESLWETGRVLFGGSREFDLETQQRLQHLASKRLDVVQAWLQERDLLSAEQLVRTRWDGKVRDGIPRVNLRLRMREK